MASERVDSRRRRRARSNAPHFVAWNFILKVRTIGSLPVCFYIAGKMVESSVLSYVVEARATRR